MLKHITMFSLIALVGCGGGGGGHASKASADDPRLGQRSVPEGTIAVSRDGDLRAGAPCALVIHLEGFTSTPVRIEAGLGVEYVADATGVTALPVEGAPDTFRVTVDVPTAISAGSHAWIRALLSDGSIVETGTDDFPIRAD